MSYDIMSLSLREFAKSYQADRPHKINRYMGGNRRANHPYISGYWYLIMDPPEEIFLGSSTDQNSGVHQARDWFHSTAESFTPPTKSITKVDVPGMGGMASSYIAGQEFTREFTVAFREYQSLPISTAIRTWCSVMDPHLGRSPMRDFVPVSYKGQAFAILCKPTLTCASSGANYEDGSGTAPLGHDDLTPHDIEQVYYFEGVFPTTIPDDAFSTDIATNDVAQLSVTFSFDGGFHTKESEGVVNEAIQRLREIKNSDSYLIGLKDMHRRTDSGAHSGAAEHGYVTSGAGPHNNEDNREMHYESYNSNISGPNAGVGGSTQQT